MQSEKNFTDIQASLEKKTDAWLRKRIYKKRICSWSRGSFDMKPNRSSSSMDYTNVVSSANGSPGQRKLLKREKKNPQIWDCLCHCSVSWCLLFCSVAIDWKVVWTRAASCFCGIYASMYATHFSPWSIFWLYQADYVSNSLSFEVDIGIYTTRLK